MKKHYHWFAMALMATGALFLSFGLLENEPAKIVFPEDLKGIIVDSPPTHIPDFKLTTHTNETFTKGDLKGKWTLMFFGYTHCPDVCPTSLRVLDGVSNDESLPKDTQYVFTTVDPGRDDVAKMKDFVTFFNESFVGLTGDKAEIDKLAERLGVIYDYEGDTSSDDYVVNHFAAVYVFDPHARMRAYILPPHDVQKVSRAFKLISDYYK